MTTPLYQKNIDALNSYHPDLANRIPSFSLDELSKKFHVEILPNDGVTLREGDYVIDTTAPGFLPNFEMPEHAVKTLFICGFGVGSLFNHVASSLRGQVEEIYIVEPSMERFQIAMALQDWSSLFSQSRIHWIVGESVSSLDLHFYQYLSIPERLKNAKAYHFAIHPVIQAFHTQYFENLEGMWKAALELQMRSRGTCDDSLVGFRNAVANLNWIKKNPGMNLLRNQMKGIPAVVCSSGPSLTKSLPELKKIQNKAVLIAADSALRPLLLAGIIPHFTVTLERDDETQPLFEGLPPEAKKTHLIAYPIVPQKLLETYPGPQWAIYRDYEYLGFFESQYERGHIRSGPTVAHMAVEIASYLGCSELTLVGQDLSYDSTTLASHAEGIDILGWGVPKDKEELLGRLKKRHEDFFFLAGNLEKEVPTSTLYYIFGLLLSEEIRSGKFEKARNSTEGGAQIPGIVWEPLSKVSAGWKETKNIFAQLDAVRASFKSEGAFSTKPILDSVKYFEEELGRYQELVSTFINAFDDRPGELSPWIEKLRSSQLELLKDRAFQALVNHFMQAEYLQFEWAWQGLKEGDAARVDRMKLLLFKAWVTFATEVVGKVKTEFNRQIAVSGASGETSVSPEPRSADQ